MAEKSSWVKIYRSMMQWSWYTDPKTSHLFLHIILAANAKPGKWRDLTVDRGQLVTSVSKLSVQTGLSERSVRTSLNHLISTGEVTSQSTNRYTLITVNNYDSYQDRPTSKSTSESTSNRQANRQQSKNIRSKEGKNINARAREEWETRRNVPEQFRGRFNDEHEWMVFIGEADPCDMS